MSEKVEVREPRNVDGPKATSIDVFTGDDGQKDCRTVDSDGINFTIITRP
jgi:hypothetical protein